MSLTDAAYYFKKYLPYLAVVFLIIMIIFYIFKLLFMYLGGLTKPQEIAYKEIEGIEGFKLEKPQFSSSGIDTAQGIKFTLDNPEGRPIEASQAAVVYYVPPTVGKIENKNKAESMAMQQKIGFNKATMQKKLNTQENKYVFTDMYRDLAIDLTNFNFTYKYEMKRDAQLFTNIKMFAESEIKNQAIAFLKAMGKYPEEFAQGRVNVIYIDYNRLTNTSTIVKRPQEANMVEVDFFRADVGSLQVVTPTYFNSQNYVVIVPKEDEPKVVNAQVKFFEKSTDLTGIYALKTGDEAWQNLASGSAYIAYNEASNKKNITIRKMELRYYDPDAYQQTIQPVFVFLGDNFAAYVPALKESYFQ